MEFTLFFRYEAPLKTHISSQNLVAHKKYFLIPITFQQ